MIRRGPSCALLAAALLFFPLPGVVHVWIRRTVRGGAFFTGYILSLNWAFLTLVAGVDLPGGATAGKAALGLAAGLCVLAAADIARRVLVGRSRRSAALVETLRAEALRHEAEDRNAEAEDCLRRLLARSPDDVDARLVLGRVLLRRRQTRAGIRTLRSARRLTRSETATRAIDDLLREARP